MTLSLPTLIGCIAILLWSCLALFTAATGTIPPFELAALTFAISGLCGLALAAWRGELHLLRQPLPVWALGVGGLFGYHALYFSALRLAPPAEAGLIAYLWPLLIVLFSALLPGESLRPRHVLGALLGLTGVVILLFAKNGGFSFDAKYLAGYLLAFACAFVWSGYSVLSRAFKNVPTIAVTGFCLATAALAYICSALFETWHPLAWNGRLLAIVALGIGPVGLAFFVWDYGVKNGDIRFLGVASYAAPVLSTLILVLTGYASASWMLALACVFIVGGAIIATRQSRI